MRKTERNTLAAIYRCVFVLLHKQAEKQTNSVAKIYQPGCLSSANKQRYAEVFVQHMSVIVVSSLSRHVLRSKT